VSGDEETNEDAPNDKRRKLELAFGVLGYQLPSSEQHQKK
jgi:hypothetical protein